LKGIEQMIVAPVLVALLVAAAPQGTKKTTKPAPKSGSALPSNVVARYNGIDITVEDIRKQVSMTLARKVVPDLIQRAVIEKQAKLAGVTVTPAELASKVSEEQGKVISQMAQSTGVMMKFDQITREYGLSEAEIKESVRLNLLARKAFEKSIAKEVPSLDGQLRLAHILIATVPLAPGPESQVPLTKEQQEKKDAEQKVRIEQILADVKAGKIRFEDAAKQFSDDKGSGAQGGELPWAGKGTFVAEFETAAYALQKPGDITPPVKSQFGWHVIKLLAKGSDAPPAEKAKYKQDQLNQRLNQQGAVQQWLAGLSRGAKIQFNVNAKLK
jgi:PPIC-type PPIASE domain/SurA N-terminal domain